MRLGYSADERAFLAEVREFLVPWRGLNQFLAIDNDAQLRRFYRALGERNWLSLCWPKDVGGLGLPPIYEFLLWDEMAYWRMARPPLSAGIVAKTIIRYGSQAQKDRWLPAIQKGEIMFSLGYSEPSAGSDLAGLQTRAETDPQGYRLNGIKTWSSVAHASDFLWLLCRTGEPGSRARGLSLIIVDLKSENLRIRPMDKMSGNTFCELTIDDVLVPDDHRIGPENGAWGMMNASLADERHVQFPPKRVLADYEAVRDWAIAQGLDQDPVVRERLSMLSVRTLECQALALRIIAAGGDQRMASIAAAANKRHSTDTIQAIARAAMEFGAPEALVVGQQAEFLWRQTMEETVGGGTSEIMTSIVARQALGLNA